MMKTLIHLQAIDLHSIVGLLSPDDCAALIAIGQQDMERATVTDADNLDALPHADRVCQMAWPHREEHPLLQRISEGIARITGISQDCQEPLQVLRYGVGGEYKPHFDAFETCSEETGNRQATLILYLNHVEAGGGTAFPKLGLQVAPITGGGVFFRNLDARGQRLPLSLHAGSPVLKGEKWIATTWIRERPYL